MGAAIGRLHIHPYRSKDGPAPAADTDSQTPLDVGELTRRMAAGDERAYRSFYDAYFDRLSRYLLVVTAGDEDAMHEALQETFRRVVRHIRVFTDEDVFWSWLTVLARSARSDENRKRRRYFAFLDRFARHVAVDHVASIPDEAGEDLEGPLERCMSSLPAGERTLLELKYFQHCSVHEIAGQHQTTEKAIESRLVRARQRLKQLLLVELEHETPD